MQLQMVKLQMVKLQMVRQIHILILSIENKTQPLHPALDMIYHKDLCSYS